MSGLHVSDMIEIQEVALLGKGQKWDEKVYAVAGHVMDGVRGVNSVV